MSTAMVDPKDELVKRAAVSAEAWVQAAAVLGEQTKIDEAAAIEASKHARLKPGSGGIPTKSFIRGSASATRKQGGCTFMNQYRPVRCSRSSR